VLAQVKVKGFPIIPHIMKLMIVDDHASTREMIRNFLSLPGITFRECASGDEALKCAREFQPDWVTLDVNMPGLNGFQSAEALRLQNPSARVMIVTGYNEPHFRKLSNSVGAVDLICKENLMTLHTILSDELARPVPSLSTNHG
jgi:CheY-like chemotaxis protein